MAVLHRCWIHRQQTNRTAMYCSLQLCMCCANNDWCKLSVPVHKPRTWQCHIGVESTGSKQTWQRHTSAESTGSKQTGQHYSGAESTGSKQTRQRHTGAESTGSKWTRQHYTGAESTGSKQTWPRYTGAESTGRVADPRLHEYWAVQAGLLTSLTFAQHCWSPLSAFTSGVYFLHSDSEFVNFTLPTLKAFLEAHSQNVSGNKQ